MRNLVHYILFTLLQYNRIKGTLDVQKGGSRMARSDNKKYHNQKNSGKGNQKNYNGNGDNKKNLPPYVMKWDIKVSCGMKPSDIIRVYAPNLTDVTKGVQLRFDQLTSGLREERGWTINDVSIDMSMSNFGAYVFFGLTLPMSTLHQKKSQNNILSLTDENDEDQVRLKEPFHLLLQSYAYNKEERRMFDDPKTRKALGLKPDVLENIKNLMTPKIQTKYDSSGRSHKAVYVLVDPLKVLHDMLQEVDDAGKIIENQPKFKVGIKKIDEIRAGNCRLTVERIVMKSEDETHDVLTLDSLLLKSHGVPRNKNRNINNNNNRQNNNRGGYTSRYRRDNRR